MNTIRWFVRGVLLLITLLVLLFALLSGSEDYGGGIMGILKNSPNALPWVFLLAINFLIWKKELLGGIILVIFGLLITYYFNFYGSQFYISVFVMTSIITLLGIFFVVLGFKRRDVV